MEKDLKYYNDMFVTFGEDKPEHTKFEYELGEVIVTPLIGRYDTVYKTFKCIDKKVVNKNLYHYFKQGDNVPLFIIKFRVNNNVCEDITNILREVKIPRYSSFSKDLRTTYIKFEYHNLNEDEENRLMSVLKANKGKITSCYFTRERSVLSLNDTVLWK